MTQEEKKLGENEALEVAVDGGNEAVESSWQRIFRIVREVKDAAKEALLRDVRSFSSLESWHAFDVIEGLRKLTPVEFRRKFGVEPGVKVFNYLMENADTFQVVESLKYLQGLGAEELIKLASNVDGYNISSIMENYSGVGDKRLAMLFIERGHAMYVGYHLERFEGLDEEVALALIDRSDPEIVLNNLDAFGEVDRNRVAEAFVEKGLSYYVVQKIDQFGGWGAPMVVKMIEDSRYPFVYSLPRIRGLGLDVAKKLIELNYVYEVANNLASFRALNQEIADDLIERRYIKEVVEHIDMFEGLDRQKLFNKLRNSGEMWLLVKNLEKFGDQDLEPVLEMLCSRGRGDLIVENFDKFGFEDHAALVDKLFEEGMTASVLDGLDKFKGVNRDELLDRVMEKDSAEIVRHLGRLKHLKGDYAMRLVDRGPDFAAAVVNHIEAFDGLDRKTLQLKLIDDGHGDLAVKSLGLMNGLSVAEAADKLIETKQAGQIVNNMDVFRELDSPEFVMRLIDELGGLIIAMGLENFEGLDAAVMDRLIEERLGYYVARHIGRFGVKPDLELAERLIAKGEITAVIAAFDKFDIEDHAGAVYRFIEMGHGSDVAQHIEKFAGVDRLALVPKLIEAGCQHALIAQVNKFAGLDNAEFALRMLRDGYGNIVAEHLEKFEPGDYHLDLADGLIEAGSSSTVADNLEKFVGIDRIKVMNAVIDSRKAYYAIQYLGKFGVTDYGALIDRLIETKQGSVVADNIEKFEGIDHQAVAMKLIESGAGRSVADNIEKFDGVDQRGLANTMIERGLGWSLVSNLAKFSDLSPVDHKELGDEFINIGLAEEMLRSFRSFQRLNVSVIDKLLEANGGHQVATSLDIFEGLADDSELMAKIFEDRVAAGAGYDVLKRVIEFSDKLNVPLFARTEDILGEFADGVAFNIVRAIFEGKLDEDEMKRIGITKAGEAGMNQLREFMRNFRREVVKPNFDFSQVKESPLLVRCVMVYTRFNTSQWGAGSLNEFERTLSVHMRVSQEDDFRKLPSEYEESGEILVDKIDISARDKFEYSEQFLSRFELLKSNLKGAVSLFESPDAVRELIEKAKKIRREVVKDLKEALVDPDPEKARGRPMIKKKIEALEACNLSDIANFKQNFKLLSGISEFYPVLTELFFYFALLANATYRERAIGVANGSKVEFDDIGWMLDFVDHIVNKEVWSQYFDDKKMLKSFRKIVSIAALEEDYKRAQNQATAAMKPMEFVPTRGPLMEFSGHIADACWASKYPSIAKEFPNMSSVIMIQNPRNEYERLAGACMLIEATSAEGEPLLIIRGLNPLENVINELSVGDFYRKFTDYAKGVAEKMGRKLAIVIDNYKGGSASNRPNMFNYLLEDVKPKAKQVKLSGKEVTTFNGYDISNNVYLV